MNQLTITKVMSKLMGVRGFPDRNHSDRLNIFTLITSVVNAHNCIGFSIVSTKDIADSEGLVIVQ